LLAGSRSDLIHGVRHGPQRGRDVYRFTGVVNLNDDRPARFHDLDVLVWLLDFDYYKVVCLPEGFERRVDRGQVLTKLLRSVSQIPLGDKVRRYRCEHGWGNHVDVVTLRLLLDHFDMDEALTAEHSDSSENGSRYS
jgi:hypothetical protein